MGMPAAEECGTTNRLVKQSFSAIRLYGISYADYERMLKDDLWHEPSISV